MDDGIQYKSGLAGHRGRISRKASYVIPFNVNEINQLWHEMAFNVILHNAMKDKVDGKVDASTA